MLEYLESQGVILPKDILVKEVFKEQTDNPLNVNNNNAVNVNSANQYPNNNQGAMPNYNQYYNANLAQRPVQSVPNQSIQYTNLNNQTQAT